MLVHLGGLITVTPTVPLKTRDDLSMAYTPGGARVCQAIAACPAAGRSLTIKQNAVIRGPRRTQGRLRSAAHVRAVPRMSGRYMDLEARPLDTGDRRALVRREIRRALVRQEIRRALVRRDMRCALSNITTCRTEAHPEHIKITDDAVVQLKERAVDATDDPVAWLGGRIHRHGPRHIPEDPISALHPLRTGGVPPPGARPADSPPGDPATPMTSLPDTGLAGTPSSTRRRGPFAAAATLVGLDLAGTDARLPRQPLLQRRRTRLRRGRLTWAFVALGIAGGGLLLAFSPPFGVAATALFVGFLVVDLVLLAGHEHRSAERAMSAASRSPLGAPVPRDPRSAFRGDTASIPNVTQTSWWWSPQG